MAAAVDRDIGFRYPVQIFNPHFDISFGYLCSGCDRLRFSRVVGLISFVFHYWGRGCSCLRLRGVWLSSFVGFARNLLRRLTREWVVNMADEEGRGSL